MLYSATATLPNGLRLIISVSALRNRLVPISVNVVYFPKCNNVLLLAAVALLIYFKPSHPAIILTSEVMVLMISMAQTNWVSVMLKKKKFITSTVKNAPLLMALSDKIFPYFLSACNTTNALFHGRFKNASNGYQVKNT